MSLAPGREVSPGFASSWRPRDKLPPLGSPLPHSICLSPEEATAQEHGRALILMRTALEKSLQPRLCLKVKCETCFLLRRWPFLKPDLLMPVPGFKHCCESSDCRIQRTFFSLVPGSFTMGAHLLLLSPAAPHSRLFAAWGKRTHTQRLAKAHFS